MCGILAGFSIHVVMHLNHSFDHLCYFRCFNSLSTLDFPVPVLFSKYETRWAHYLSRHASCVLWRCEIKGKKNTTPCGFMQRTSSLGLANVQNSVWVECGMDREFLAECFGPAESLSPVRSETDRAAKSEEDHSCCSDDRSDEDDDVTVLLWEALCEDDSGEEESCSPDPNRPRFTLQELRDVLQEKNELKAQVFMLQEELAYYKSEEEQEEQMVLLPPAPSLPPRPPSRDQPDSGIKRLFSFLLSDKLQLLSISQPQVLTREGQSNRDTLQPKESLEPLHPWIRM